MRVHLDNDFLVHALSRRGAERERLQSHERAGDVIEMSAIAWYEFSRGPRTPEQLAVARAIFEEDGIVPLAAEICSRQGRLLRRRVAQASSSVLTSGPPK